MPFGPGTFVREGIQASDEQATSCLVRSSEDTGSNEDTEV